MFTQKGLNADQYLSDQFDSFGKPLDFARSTTNSVNQLERIWVKVLDFSQILRKLCFHYWWKKRCWMSFCWKGVKILWMLALQTHICTYVDPLKRDNRPLRWILEQIPKKVSLLNCDVLHEQILGNKELSWFTVLPLLAALFWTFDDARVQMLYASNASDQFILTLLNNFVHNFTVNLTFFFWIFSFIRRFFLHLVSDALMLSRKKTRWLMVKCWSDDLLGCSWQKQMSYAHKKNVT